MAGRTSAEAVNNFLGPLQLALSCVTDGVVNVAGGYHPSDEPHAATLNGGLAVTLAGPTRLGLIVTMHYRVVEDPGPRGPWKVSTAAYIYELTDEQEQRIVAYHWHPAGRSAITWPHLHLARSGSSARTICLLVGSRSSRYSAWLWANSVSRPAGRTGPNCLSAPRPPSRIGVRGRDGAAGFRDRRCQAASAAP